LTRLEEVEGVNAREYLKQVNKRISDLQKEFETIIKSRQIISLTFSNRLEILEKKLERKK